MANYRFGGGGLGSMPPVVKSLLIINVLVFFLQYAFQRSGSYEPFERLFALHDIHSVYFKPHQLITHLFMHGGFTHIFFNMLALWMFGSTLEGVWGSKRFFNFYMICGLGAAVLHLGILYVENAPIMDIFHQLSPAEQDQLLYSDTFKINVATIGASGAVFGCLAAFAYLFPNQPLYIYGLFPVKAKWLILGYAGLELYLGIRNSAGDNVAHWAHLGGALAGIIMVLLWNKTNRRNFY